VASRSIFLPAVPQRHRRQGLGAVRKPRGVL